MISKIFLYGPPGSGKTTLGKALAQRLEVPFLDLDNRIVERSGLSIPALFEAAGEAGFRAREAETLREAVAERSAAVVALGGGALLAEANRTLVEASGTVICLHAPLAVLVTRAAGQPGSRPLLERGGPASPEARVAALTDLLARRAEHYRSFPNQLDACTDDVDAKVAEAQVLAGAFRISGMGRPYDVRVGAGLLADLPAWFTVRGWQGATAVVADSATASYGREAVQRLAAAGRPARLIAIPAGEANKTIATVGSIWRGLLEAGLDRDGTVVAVGGGVPGDLAGFAAATWLRGVRWVVAPTTLLAMVDSSLGGKTAADLVEGKNLIGAFHPPDLVLADTATLATLPLAEKRSGMAEVVKHGIIADPQLFERIERAGAALLEDRAALTPALVSRALAVKARVIQSDPFERGPRAALNLGHTVGHALEQATNYGLRHGEAVAIGMVAEARIAERLGLAQAGLAERIAAVLESLGLPVAFPVGVDAAAFSAALQLDKKRRGGSVRFALPAAIGDVRTGVPVDAAIFNTL